MANELQEFIQETLKQIQAGTVGHMNTGDIDFEIAIAKSVSKDGSVNVKVLGVGGEWKNESVSKVKFSARLNGAIPRMTPLPWPPK